MEKAEILVSQDDKEVKIDESLYYENDAYNNAPFISKILYLWAFKIIKLANITLLKNEYLGKLESSNKAQSICDKFSDVWYVKNYQNKKKYALLLALIRANLATFMEAMFFILVLTLLQILEVMLLKEFINLYEHTKRDYKYEVFISVSFIFVKIFSMLISKRAAFLQTFLADRPLIQLNNLIMKKVLKESPSNSKNKYTQGEMINLIASDSAKMRDLFRNLPTTIFIPIKIIAYTVILFKNFGLNFIYGFLVMILILIANTFLQRQRRKIEKLINNRKDSRMKITTELLNHLKFVKLFSWEKEFKERLFAERNKELDSMSQKWLISSTTTTLFNSAPSLVSMVSVGAYYMTDHYVRLSNIFLLINIFNNLQDPLRMLPNMLTFIIEVLAGLERIEKYMKQDDIDESQVFYNDFGSISRGEAIKIKNGNFSWGKVSTEKNEEIKKDSNKIEIEPELKPVLKNININIKKGELVMVIGEVGSGKSSLFQSIMNNLLIIDDQSKKAEIFVNGSVSYVSQTSWIRNTTLRDNITFFKKFVQDKYEKIITISQLIPDIKVLNGGDLAEIGEKGINLSGGQKARITIARALYSDSDIYLFDDPISALDAHVGEKVMNNCILDYLKNKTRLLITHAVQYLHFADKIIVMKNGEIYWEGVYDDLKNEDFYQDYIKKIRKKEKSENTEEVEEYSHDVNKKVVERITSNEEQEQGTVKKSIYLKYFKYFGGYGYITLVLLIVFVWQSLSTFSDIWLTLWTKWQNKRNYPFFTIYAIMSSSTIIFIFLRFFLISKGTTRASKIIHEKMIKSLVKAPINTFHDTIPKGRILNRLSKDIMEVDMYIVWDLATIIIKFFRIFASIIVCGIFIYYSLFFIPIMVYVGFRLTKFYIKSSQDLTRIDRLNRSPLMNIFSETVSGAITIRAFKYEKQFIDLYLEKLEELYKSNIFKNGTNQWFSLAIDTVNVTFFTILILFTLLMSSSLGLNAQGVSLILNSTFSLQSSIMDFLDYFTDLESDMVSVERCLKYVKLPEEAPGKMKIDQELASFPDSGEITFQNYSVRYRPGTPIVLKNLSFKIKAGEKIGVVGRTGSGKSTLCLSLFRILEADEGKIYIDGIDSSSIGLKLLRSSITIIPQDAVLMEGTLKYNIDPLNERTDLEITESLRQVGLFSFLENEKGINMIINENGSNISVGERQLISIARAILRRTKIVILDEATANIDFKTEELIQRAIRNNFKESTLITIAHRIQTIIDYDKILLLSKGELIEYDTPENLIKDKTSEFYKLYTKSV